jgi:hypothetical protein
MDIEEFVRSQVDLPEDFKKLLEENFWNLILE